jgi:predicted nucleic acid-binding protein
MAFICVPKLWGGQVIKTGIAVIGLDPKEVLALAEVSKRYHLDFDDAYQYAVAQKYGLQIMSFDTDFDRTEKGRKIPELK